MNLHQILTGAANTGDRCFAVGSVEGNHFTAYAAGCNIVILDGKFQRVQIISGIENGSDVEITCISCCSDVGKIAASYGSKIQIFEPAPLLQNEVSQSLKYRWYPTGNLDVDGEVLALTWNMEGSRLLTSCSTGPLLQMWQSTEPVLSRDGSLKRAEFFIEDNERVETYEWNCIWRCRLANPATILKFSSDGLLFATAGKDERLVKIWYENAKIPMTLVRCDSISPKNEALNFSFIFLAHPRAVTGFTWRRTSKYMQKGTVANMLITSCKDTICRIWCETFLPEDGLLDVRQLEMSTANTSLLPHSQQNKHKLIQRLHHIRRVLHKRKRPSMGGANTLHSHQSNSNPWIESSSAHDNHKYGAHSNGITPTFHFHLASTVQLNSATDSKPSNFVVHWLNNKEFQATLEAERILEEMEQKAAALESQMEAESGGITPSDLNSPAESRTGTMANGLHSVESESVLNDQQMVDKKKRSSLLKTKNFMSVDSDKSAISTATAASAAGSDQGNSIPDVSKDGGTTDQWESQIEQLIHNWNQAGDILFGIHPTDGSLLIWLVHYLDESVSGSFRQVQVSFQSSFPSAFPVCDAITMEPNIWLYCDYARLDLKSLSQDFDLKCSDAAQKSSKLLPQYCATESTTKGGSSRRNDHLVTPNVLVLTKHTNGSLNLWRMSFAEKSQFTNILSMSHVARACGHRFQANSATCHPVLPLLLTTSHHNTHDACDPSDHCHEVSNNPFLEKSASLTNSVHDEGFCSELILWRVIAVGPLSKSGGISELARINSPVCSAFANVAWLPTLLPTSSLGSKSNSPSALFVASNGTTLRIYQAVLDARFILAEQEAKTKKKMPNVINGGESPSSIHSIPNLTSGTDDILNIISHQSTSRPGCIIDLVPITDASQSWQHIQLIHVFQEQMVTGCRSTTPTDFSAFVNLQNIRIFEERFFLVVIEKIATGASVLHMWQIVIASQDHGSGVDYTHDTVFVQDDDGTDSGPDSFSFKQQHSTMNGGTENSGQCLYITTNKVCSQLIPLPPDVSVISATVAAGHLSSSSIYPACFAPYLISTACTDGQVYFWRCEVTDGEVGTVSYEWKEWEMMIQTDDSSSIYIPGKPLSVSCAYNGRVAVAYRIGGSKARCESFKEQFSNLCVAIYECESTGGSEWTLEDTLNLKTIDIPDLKIEIDPNLIYDNELDMINENQRPQSLVSPTLTTPVIIRTSAVPSSATVQSVRRSLCNKTPKAPNLHLRHLVHLDWVSTENGSHILTVGIGPQILLYAAVSSEMASVFVKEDGDKPAAPSRGILQKTKSMAVHRGVQDLRWIKLRSIELRTADGLAPLPMHISWVRNGILVVGMDNEMHIYSQWQCTEESLEVVARDQDQDTASEASKTLPTSPSFLMPRNPALSKSASSIKLDASIANLSLLAEKKDRKKDGRASAPIEMPKSESLNSLRMIQDSGLFEAARLANPILPQYHPKQLIELLNFGRIRRVKAILSHLLRCISGESRTSSQGWQRNRNLSAIASPKSPSDGMVTITDDSQTDYLEISSIPPLPLFALLAADNDPAFSNTAESSAAAASIPNNTETETDGYNSLFTFEVADDGLEDPFSDLDPNAAAAKEQAQHHKMVPWNPNSFNPAQASLLAKHLIHTQLPGMSSLDQMYLLALAETVANTKVDFSDSCPTTKQASGTGLIEPGLSEAAIPEAIDDCGLRFLLAARHHVYLMNTLPIRQRAELQKQGLSSAYYIWAFHSESEEELLNALPCMQKGNPTWAELRQFGAGWWLRNINVLTRCIEKLAKAAFQASKDPLDAALFYLAMKKKNLLWGLFRSVDDSRMAQFFRNNFSEDRWRRAALKNAFTLLGKQRFQCAAAFFLLGGAVTDAVEVCLTKLDDIQLALVILRLYENDLEASTPSSFKNLLQEKVLGVNPSNPNDVDSDLQDPPACSDPFLRSMAYWILNDYSSALETLLETYTKLENKSMEEGMDCYTARPSVFNFYNYLRTHPLLVRQHLATTAVDKSKTVLLSGFSYGAKVAAGDKNVTYVDRITPVERRLYFMTAHEHFKNGCPALALEVLTKLPAVIDLSKDVVKSRSTDSVVHNKLLRTGSLNMDTESNTGATANSFDWSQPTRIEKVEEVDWSQPTLRFDDDKLDLDFGITSSDNEDEILEDKPSEKDISEDQSMKVEVLENSDKRRAAEIGDIMAHQLKFIACIKIIVDELSTLATGFEVDGGQLRYQLYVWLEKEVEVLKQVCNYVSEPEITTAEKMPETATDTAGSETADGFKPAQTSSQADSSGLTLHELLQAEKLDFDAKQRRIARRKNWLKANHQLLATLMSYSILHGSCGGGLASMRMELLLLLQELQQESTMQQQLLSPLPFPTTLPLVSSSIASAKTVVADPIQHLQNMSQDLLGTMIEFVTPPTSDTMPNKIFLLRSLGSALSACIYQCLCDSDTFVVSIGEFNDVGMEGFTSTNVLYKDSHLMAGVQSRQRHSSMGHIELPKSEPAQWPGVSSLITLMKQKRDDDSPRLNILLMEALVAVYTSLLYHALAMYDAIVLYRLVGRTFTEDIWPTLFGGSLKQLVKVATATTDLNKMADSIMKGRMKLTNTLMGPQVSNQRFIDTRPTYKERFVPPQMSMVSYFMTKVKSEEHPGVDYDSAESVSSHDEDEDDFEDSTRASTKNDLSENEHLDPKSYSWCLMRYAIVKYILNSMTTFLPKIGIEVSELPHCSPLVHSLIKNLEHWEKHLQMEMDAFPGPPFNYIPGCYVEQSSSFAIVTIQKYSSLMDPANTPFTSKHYSARPAKRLWHYLVTRDYLQDIFIRYVFKSQSSPLDCNMKVSSEAEPMKIIHKDQDTIMAFALNQANLNCMVMATPKELIESDVTNILNPPTWIQDDVNYDIEVIKNPLFQPDRPEDMLVLRTPGDSRILGGALGAASPDSSSKGGSMPSTVLLKRPDTAGVRRLVAHPQLPYYVSGSEDGCVRLWEWGTIKVNTEIRKPGAFPKVTKVLFNAYGNKLGVSDTEGAICLWQVGSVGTMSKPYLSQKCHSKVTSDFVFVGSSSLLASAGHSSDNRNVCLWDTLLPQRRMLVQSFQCHTDGCPAILYAPQHQVLISGGKKGEICIFDVRQRQLRQTFQAHDSAIKCLSLDPSEDLFVTGSADGDIKVWGLTVHNLLHSFSGEHSKGSSSLFRNTSSGVIQVCVSPEGNLFSCGNDGTLKVRQLMQKRQSLVVNSWYNKIPIFRG